MSEEGNPVLLIGPEEETRQLARRIESEGYLARRYSDFDSFMVDLLHVSPQAVVLWDSLCGPDLDAALGLLRHHACSCRCSLIVARSDRACHQELPSCANAVMDCPVDPDQLCSLIREHRDTGAETADVPRILVVDDDENILLLGSHIVKELGMFPVVALDGTEALEKCRRLRPDLILLDINMPTMDGFEVIKFLKADASLSLIPIIVFSARKSEEDKVRALKMGADDYVTKPFGIAELGARIDRLLDRTRTGVSASSTTGLPGSVSVEQAMVERIHRRVPFAVLYLDVDHFKAFNDRYGFSRGDSVIRQTADLLLESVRKEGSPGDFVGHIGGDDFVAVTEPERAVSIAESMIERFDHVVPFYYDPEDRKRGGIETEDRKGVRTMFPIMSISIAIVTSETRTFHHAGEVADVAAQLKKYAKTCPGSVWVKDKRSDDGE